MIRHYINRVLASVLCISVVLSLFSCNSKDIACESSRVYIDLEKSYYCDLKTDGGFVHYRCYITLNNISSELVKIKLLGCFDSEYKKGIVLSNQSYGIVDGEEIISIKPNSSYSGEVIFSFELSVNNTSTALKIDRLLPNIVIQNTNTKNTRDDSRT